MRGSVTAITTGGASITTADASGGDAPPPRKYPLVTQLRGLAGHFAYGLGLLAGVEAGWRLLGGRPR